MATTKRWRTYQTRTGLKVKVRPLTPGDVDHLVNLFEHLSPQSRYFRFNEPLENPDPELVRREAAALAQVDPERGRAWIAFADLPGEPNAPIAGFRFMRTPDPQVAEVSIAVRDDLQRQEVGTRLLLYLAKEARAAGIARLVGTFHTNNRGVWGLLAKSPYPVTTTVHGPETDVVVDLTRTVRRGRSQKDAQGVHYRLRKERNMPGPVVYSFETNDGLPIHVRPETPEDVPYMADLLQHLSPESRRERFGDPAAAASPGEAQREASRLSTLDPEVSKAWLAFADLPGQPNTPVACGRYTRTAADQATIHVVVRDDMQRRGIGSRLVYFVLDQARSDGIRKVTARFSGTNEAVWQVVQYSPYHVTWTTLGRDVEVTFHLPARTTSKTAMN
ncbi:MAG: GNAT family N-acetyltransferase [Anaerolineae bacterium]|nr:GNAT family N-acetyltransferase [Anaerolineae bacterium]